MQPPSARPSKARGLNEKLRARRGGTNAPSFSVPITVARIICAAAVLIAVWWAYFMVAVFGREGQKETRRLHPLGRQQFPRNALKLPSPIIVVGLPKSGTTSVTEYFKCGGVESSHFSCPLGMANFDGSIPRPQRWRNCVLPKGAGGPLSDGGKDPLCAVCVERNVLRGRPPLEGCGAYHVWGQLDSSEHPLPVMKKGRQEYDFPDVQPLCSYPQVTHLDRIHEAYPDATFVLNLRPVENWIASVSRWTGVSVHTDQNRTEQGGGYLRRALTKCDLPGFPSGVGGTDEELAAFYNGQTERIRDFARRHPTHALVEVQIEDEKAGEFMEEKFGIQAKCWVKQKPKPRRIHKEVSKYDENGLPMKDPSNEELKVMQLDTNPRLLAKKREAGKTLRKAKYITSRTEPSEDEDEEIRSYPYCEHVQDIFVPRAGVTS